MQSEVNPVNWAQTGVIGGLVLLVIITGVKRIWLFYWVHDEIVRGLREQITTKTTEADEWKRMALSGVGAVERTVDRTSNLIERATIPAPHVELNERLQRIDEELKRLRRDVQP